MAQIGIGGLITGSADRLLKDCAGFFGPVLVRQHQRKVAPALTSPGFSSNALRTSGSASCGLPRNANEAPMSFNSVAMGATGAPVPPRG